MREEFVKEREVKKTVAVKKVSGFTKLKNQISTKLAELSDMTVQDLKKTPPSKSALNIVIGFDTVVKKIDIMRLYGVDFSKAIVQSFSYTEHFLSDEFLEEFKSIFEEFFKGLPASHQLACYVVMPDISVAMDNIVVPSIAVKKQKASIVSQLESQHKNYKDLQITSYVAGKNRKYTCYFLTLMRKSYLTNIYKSISVNKLYPKATSYSANCALNTIYQFMPEMRKKSFLLLDVNADYTRCVVSSRGKTAGFQTVMLGFKHFVSDKVLQESMQYDHDVADLAIINAKERAKLKVLTVSSDDEEQDLDDVADSVAEQLITGENQNDKEVAEKVAFDESVVSIKQEADENVVNGVQNAVNGILPEEQEEPDVDEDEEERKRQLVEQMEQARKKKVFARKMPKRLPKFMLRPTPETPEGFVYENFRMIMKWALLFVNEVKKQEYSDDIDLVLCNMPKEYAYIMDMANSEEENNAVKFMMVPDLADGNVANSYLELVGALYTGMYNKRQNF